MFQKLTEQINGCSKCFGQSGKGLFLKVAVTNSIQNKPKLSKWFQISSLVFPLPNNNATINFNYLGNINVWNKNSE